MQKQIRLFILFFLLTLSLHAQFSERFFSRISLTLLTEVYNSPENRITTINNGDTSTSGYQYQSFSVFNIAYEPRYNLVEMGDNFALSVDVGLAFAMSVQEFTWTGSYGSAIMHFNLPVFLKIYGGAGSTYNTMNSAGFNIGIGFQSIYAGLISIDAEEELKQNMQHFYVQPLIGGGASWWMGNRLITLNFSGWLGKKGVYDYRSFYTKLALIYTFDY
jgi:hypothetical protein